MRLTSIEISGFKSFPERSKLAFDGRVTAIVGPNGCGKSNVIDAISWVLGEQSARSLRGERMEDVIFSGSDARRPTATAEVRILLSQVTAALAGLVGPGTEPNRRDVGEGSNGHGHGYADLTPGALIGAEDAELSPTLLMPAGLPAADLGDDFDDDGPIIARDVEVGRRLYRSGESEYLIDGRVCRLRDIQDLLMDSGVGVKAYAVIEQGKIGQILSARPMERRQLLEEAAGVTKYKSRRRSAELKLEAAHQNLTRVDDIVFEVEKQRGALKRQAAKARRYRRLREELRRWEKVLFAGKSVGLTQAIEDATQRLDEAREREQGAAAGLAALENTNAQLQIELAESERGATEARDAAHAHELEMGRRQQQIEFDRAQVSALGVSIAEGEAEVARLEERRAPLGHELAQQEQASTRCHDERTAAADRLTETQAAHGEALSAIEGLEGDVEASRSEVFAAINAATALQHVVDNAIEARAQLSEELSKLSGESGELRRQIGRLTTERDEGGAAVARVRTGLDAIRAARVEREAELGAALLAREARAHEMRTREQAHASMGARARSIEELVASREGYSDAARLVLSDDTGAVAHCGSVADHLDVERRYERAVEASLGDLVQYVVVPSLAVARHGMHLAASHNAGRCGFVVVDGVGDGPADSAPGSTLTPLSDLVSVDGDGASAVRALLRGRWLAPSVEAAEEAARVTDDPVAAPDGTVFRGALVVDGGGKTEARGILATKGEIRELHARMDAEQEEIRRLAAEVALVADQAVRAEAEVRALQAQEHLAEKDLLELELRLTRFDEDLQTLAGKAEQVTTESQKAQERRDSLDARQTEARQSISRLETEQLSADERFMTSQRHLLEARERVEAKAADVTDAKTQHAALSERAGALAADVARLNEAARDLDQRIVQRREDNLQTATRREMLQATIAASEAQLADDARRFDELRNQVRTLDDRTVDVRERIEAQVHRLRETRGALEDLRAEVARVDVHRATVEADLANLETACQDALQLSLEQVRRDVEELERDGTITLDIQALDVLDVSEADADDGEVEALDSESADARASRVAPTGPEDVIATLRDKIDRLGPVNMMAIDQFDELEERFEFLTTQRQDLLDSIKATGEAIARIDITTRQRFKDAFVAVNLHFQEIFSTLFGGGRAGLVLIDETDVLESGIDIIAQPPGKRLQNIQLLSGGEKALTAMALMFAIFRFKPSPFCLLDEIDAPLDDANIGRFVQMLQGMQDHTQFVLVTHNRKTMEIADRLYGVTMEEPGVSKLISVELH